MKKLGLLIGLLLLIGNMTLAEVSKSSSKADLFAEFEKLKAENVALKAQMSNKETEVQTVKYEIETVKTELAETKKKVPVVEPGHERDHKWVNFNLLSGNNLRGPGNSKDDTYGQIEIGGRKGIFDFYGYIDFYDVSHSESSDRNSERGKNKDNDTANFFSEIHPRLSLNGLTGKDLSVGPVKEWYIAGYMKTGDRGLWTDGIGIGSDWQVPWLGKLGLNFYKLYVQEDYGSSRENDWNGYLVKSNWLKKFYTFDNGSYLAYKGFMNYMWDGDYQTKDNKPGSKRSDNEYQWYNGIFWNYRDYAFGYALKYVRDFKNYEDTENNDSTGFEHYFVATYKF